MRSAPVLAELLFVLLLAVALAACGPSAPSDAADPSPTITPTATATAVAEPTASPAPTAEPAGTAQPGPTPTPDLTATPLPVPEMDVASGVKFSGDPDAAEPFMDLLARIPANEETLRGVAMRNPEAAYKRLGVQSPGPGTGSDEWQAFVWSLLDQNRLDLPPGVLLFWPSHLKRYMSEFPDLWDHLGFDARSVSAAAGVVSQAVHGKPASVGGRYQVALGDFDPERTDTAIEACGVCDELETREHSGVSYLAMGDGSASLGNRYDPPLHDNFGRGPRLLVRDGAAYYSYADGAIPEIIDALQGEAPSLADDEAFAAAVAGLAEIGAVSTVDISAETIDISEAPRGSGGDGDYFWNEETQMRAARKGPLLKPYEMLSVGTGVHDEGRHFLAVAALHEDEDAAQENAGRLERRLREGAYDGRETSSGDYVDTPWPERIERAEIGVNGRALLARIHPRGPRADPGGWAFYDRYENLFLHEATGGAE